MKKIIILREKRRKIWGEILAIETEITALDALAEKTPEKLIFIRKKIIKKLSRAEELDDQLWDIRKKIALLEFKMLQKKYKEMRYWSFRLFWQDIAREIESTGCNLANGGYQFEISALRRHPPVSIFL